MNDDAPDADFMKLSSAELDAHTLKEVASHGEDQSAVDFAPGSLIAGKYKVLSSLGKGGMGVVYKVEQIFLQETYALKAILGGTSDFAWRRFQLEAKALARIDHPSIIRLKDFGLISEGNPYFVMEFAQGETLAAILRDKGALAVEEALIVFTAIAQALAHAHKVGVIHRDLKPSNIVVRRFEGGDKELEVKILDFGIAKMASNSGQSLTTTGEIFGSPYYMSPEQSSGSAVDERSDIYSFGCVLFEALTGAPPFMGDSALATIMKHQNENPPSLQEASLGGQFAYGVEHLIGRLLAKDVSDRYQSFEEVARDLIELQSAPDSKLATAVKAKERRSRGKLPGAAVTVFLALSLVVIGIVIIGTGGLENLQDAFGVQVGAIGENQDYDSTSPLFHEPFRVVSGNPSEHVFEFPQKVSLGSLKDLVTGEKKKAEGRVIFPAGHGLRFEPSINLLESPKYFKRFQPDDLQSLSFKRLLPKRLRGANIARQDNVNDEEMPYISHLSGLEELDLNETNVTDGGLASLTGLSHLKALSVSNTRCTASGIRGLPYLMSLKELEANCVLDNDKLPRYLERSKRLQRLHLLNDVLGGGMSDDDLKPFEQMSTLRDLSLACNSKITDAGLKHLHNLENLEKLNLMGCSITPGCGKYLNPLKHLKELVIDTDTRSGWTAEAVLSLKRSLPADCALSSTRNSNAWQPIGRRFSELFH